MALMPVEWLSHSTGIFVYFGLARRDSTMYVLLSSFRGVDSTAWEHLSAFQGVAQTRYLMYSACYAIGIMRISEPSYLTTNPLKCR